MPGCRVDFDRGADRGSRCRVRIADRGVGKCRVDRDPPVSPHSRLIHESRRRAGRGKVERSSRVHMNDPPCELRSRVPSVPTHAPSITLRAPSPSITRRCDRCTRTPCRLCTRIDRDRAGAFLHVPRGHSCISVGRTHASPFVSLTTVGFWSHISMLPNARMQPISLSSSLLFAG
jgi:hypothetical protein